MSLHRKISRLAENTINTRLSYLSSIHPHQFETKPIQITFNNQTYEGLSGLTSAQSLLKDHITSLHLACLVNYSQKPNPEASQISDISSPNQELVYDLSRPLESDCSISLLDFSQPLGKQVYWHSSSHILGAALESYTKGLLVNGPAIEEGFYYDVESFNLASDDLKSLDSICQEIIKNDWKFKRHVLTKSQALDLFSYNPFKLHFISTKIAEDGMVSVYSMGDFVDLCAGPHVNSTGVIKFFKINEASAVHWLGKVTESALQRVYGVSFPSKKQSDEYQARQKEASERDHRKLGTDLYFWHPFSAGSAFFLPDGTKIYNRLISFIRNQYKFRGFTEVISPNLYNISLWKQSGHYSKYKEDMFLLNSQDEELGLKPMNCPGHCLIFNHSQKSYRDLPVRYAEFGVLHRNEITGSLSGLTRVRRFVQDDSHIFCTTEQIGSEVSSCLDFVDYIYKIFGFDYEVELSTKPKNSLGSLEIWDNAEGQLRLALDNAKVSWKECRGEGAFYGPKIDFKVKDIIGRKHQCGTIQLDFNLPKRFNLQFRAQGTGKEEKKVVYEDMEEAEVRNGFERPVIIHRAILGSLERIIGILAEHYAGKWPFWMSPRQVIILSVSERHASFAKKVMNRLISEGYYAEIDESNTSLNKKIRNAQIGKYNFIGVVGDSEVEKQTVSLRERDSNSNFGVFKVEEIVEMFKKMTPEKSKAEKEFEVNMWNN